MLPRSFYPLFPAPSMASTVAEAPVDLRQHAKWRLPVAPDLLIAPSRLAPFARDVAGTLVLNPGPKTPNLSSSVPSKSIRLIFGRIDRSRRLLEAEPKSLCRTFRLRAR